MGAIPTHRHFRQYLIVIPSHSESFKHCCKCLEAREQRSNSIDICNNVATRAESGESDSAIAGLVYHFVTVQMPLKVGFEIFEKQFLQAGKMVPAIKLQCRNGCS